MKTGYSPLFDNKTHHILWNFILSLNGTKCELKNVSDPDKQVQHAEMDAFFYIIVVLVFYASSIVLLLIKYSRKDDEDKFLNHQFAEFVKRDRFQEAQYKNRIALVRTKEILANLDAAKKNIPTIMVHACSDMFGSRQNIFADSKDEVNSGVNASSSTDHCVHMTL